MDGNGEASSDGALMTRKPAGANVVILDDPHDAARHAADWLVERLVSIDEATVSVCLSGGQTPQLLYATLARPPYRDAMPWPRIHWFWADERFVPPSDARSNYGMVKRLLFDKLAVPHANVHPVLTDGGTPAAAADAYEQELVRYYGSRVPDPDRPLFDVTLLGVGDDGHTASLFPSSPQLNERLRWVAAVPAKGTREARITLTYPALESSRHVAFIVTGAAKRDIVQAIWSGDGTLPAARLRPQGSIDWFLDRAAAPMSPS
jgi:6-phosphogluconolactonase